MEVQASMGRHALTVHFIMCQLLKSFKDLLSNRIMWSEGQRWLLLTLSLSSLFAIQSCQMQLVNTHGYHAYAGLGAA